MNKTTLKLLAVSAATMIALSGCSTAPSEEIENSVNVIEGTEQTESPTPTETQAGANSGGDQGQTQQPAPIATPTKPSDYAYPELPTDDAFAMLAELAKNTTHSTTTLGSLEKYTMVGQDGQRYNVTIGFDPTLGGNNLAVFHDYADDSDQEDIVFSINQLEGENKNIAKWLLGHQVLVLAQSTGLVTAEIKNGYVEVVYNNSGIIDRYYHQDKVLVKRERIYPTDEPMTVRTIEYGKDGEVAELISQIQ
jgi:hypothetical protein